MTASASDRVFNEIRYISALDVPPDAVLAVKSAVRLTQEQAKRIMEDVETALPGHRVLVLSPELDLTVVRDVE